MQQLNYCRQICKQFSSTIAMPNMAKESIKILSHIIDLINLSQKFMLNDGGIVCDDKEFKALDETIPLKLPYKVIALEFPNHKTTSSPSKFMPSKQVVIARELDDVGNIVVTPIAYADHIKMWSPYPEISINTTEYIDRTKINKDGYVSFRINNYNSNIFKSEEYIDDVMALLSFLNIIQCKNVNFEKVYPKKIQSCKSAFKFDTYHVLTVGRQESEYKGIGGSHRSPREHLRRGHIRRLQVGVKVWVNACFVGAGRGSGVITKDYKIKV